MSDEAFKEHLLDQLRQVTDRLDRIEQALEGQPVGAAHPDPKFYNQDGEPVGVREEVSPRVFKWTADFGNLKRSYCKKCEAPIFWVRSKQGEPYDEIEAPKGAKWTALNPEGSCHFETCKVMVKENSESDTAGKPGGATEEVPF